ncbi:MAG: M2 family metallopeptidase, partial [Clostridia bacterium]|nr:M2 family metallopeptidase [Clostridia bacterium]
MEFTKFSEIEYKRPDMEAIKASINAYIEAFPKAKNFKEAKKLFLDYQESSLDFSTMVQVANVRNTIDTTDEFYDAEMNFINENVPLLGPLQKQADELILNSPFKKDFVSEFGRIFIKDMEVGQKLISEEIIPEQIEEAKLTQEYSKVTAQCKCDFRGEECNFYGLLKHLESTDREERKEAFKAWADMYASVAPKLDEIYTKLVKLRDTMAKKLGFNNYIEYIYLANGRYDYTAEDIAKFRENVRKYITPAVAQIFEEQRKTIGVDELHYYDEALTDPNGNADPEGTTEEKIQKASEMYNEMNRQTGKFWNFMTEHELFDLESKPGKHMGGYCTFLPKYKAPFIFSNFNGTAADVDVLTHEAGHAFQAYTSSKYV